MKISFSAVTTQFTLARATNNCKFFLIPSQLGQLLCSLSAIRSTVCLGMLIKKKRNGTDVRDYFI
jgi:hypothetical protein